MKLSSVASAAAVLALARADSSPPSCGAGQSACPEEYPCCSADGTCGNGYVCLGGCDPRYSHEPGACVAMPACQSGTYTFNGTDGISKYADYLGDAQKQPWSYFGNITSVDGVLRAQMTESVKSTTISSSQYIWYGKVTIKMKTSRTGGVVSDFILLSGSKDEIDYEMPGYELENAQTNYYFQGIEDYHNMIKANVDSDTNANWHEYTIDWQENQISWSIDGNQVRTLNKEDTKNQTTGSYAYPQTPSRIQFGLWAAGSSGAQGTVEWAGGDVNWNAPDMQDPGYFFVEVESIDVQCYDPPSGANKTGSKSYRWTGKDALENDVSITDDSTILEATDGTGLDLKGPYGHNSSSSSSQSSTKSLSVISGASSASSSSSSSKKLQTLTGGGASSSSAKAKSTKSSSKSSDSSSSASSSASASSSSSSPASSSASASSSADSTSGNVAGARASNTVSSSAASSSSQSSSSSKSSSAAKNNAAKVVAPALVAFLPAFLL